MENWFGLVRGNYFGQPPLYVDTTRAPGMSDLPKPTILEWVKKSPFLLITSPNFVWSIISLCLYFYAPYTLGPDSSAALAPISYRFMHERLQLWLPLVLGYFSFWHVTLYGFNMASRPFISDRIYSLRKVVHNVFWTSSGIVIWTAFENVVCYLWATGRLPYIQDSLSFTTVPGLIGFLAVLVGIPVWRSIHFYFAHRFLHYGALYQQVHSLHHRNTDTEPFSGLTMHPIEHLYYFSCIAPSLLFTCSPFAFVWNGVHLLLSPAASHSGYEDHFQSDLFHYLHHRYFECNYAGSDAAFMDIFFGTFKGSFSEHPVDKYGPKPRDDARSNLLLLPTAEFTTYLSLSSMCIGIWYYVALHNLSLSTSSAIAIASLVGFGPVLLSNGVSFIFGKNSVKLSSTHLLADILHLCMGTLFCSIPITYLCYLTIGPN